jgi:hypothetical protein
MSFIDILLPDPKKFFVRNKKIGADFIFIPIVGYKNINTDFGGRTVVKNDSVYKEYTITITYDVILSDSSKNLLSGLFDTSDNLRDIYQTRNCTVLIHDHIFEAFISAVPSSSKYYRSNDVDLSWDNGMKISIIVDRKFLNLQEHTNHSFNEEVKEILSRFELMEIE